MIKNTINLLQPELITTPPFITLKRVMILWGSVIGLLVVAMITLSLLLASATDDHQQLSERNKILTKTVTELEQQVANLKPDPARIAELKKLKVLMTNKQFFHQQLTDQSRTYVAGFSQAMKELSDLHHQDISLREVHINQDDMSFSGVARAPSAVPKWLSGFEQSKLLSGKSFVHFHLLENSDKFTEFVVSTSPVEKAPEQQSQPSLLPTISKPSPLAIGRD